MWNFAKFSGGMTLEVIYFNSPQVELVWFSNFKKEKISKQLKGICGQIFKNILISTLNLNYF